MKKRVGVGSYLAACVIAPIVNLAHLAMVRYVAGYPDGVVSSLYLPLGITAVLLIVIGRIALSDPAKRRAGIIMLVAAVPAATVIQLVVLGIGWALFGSSWM